MVLRRNFNTSRTRAVIRRAKARANATAMAGGDSAPYTASSSNHSIRDWITSAGDADSVLLRSLPGLRNKSEHSYRNFPAARAVLNRIATGTVGSGLAMRSVIDRKFLGMDKRTAREWGDNAERLFRFFADSKECSFCRQMTFGQIQNLGIGTTKGYEIPPTTTGANVGVRHLFALLVSNVEVMELTISQDSEALQNAIKQHNNDESNGRMWEVTMTY